MNISGGFNITRLQNSILPIPDQYLAQNALLNGEPIDAFYMWKAIGILQSQKQVDKAAKPANVMVAPGDIQFEDIS